MSMWSDRKEHQEQEKLDHKLRVVGSELRKLSNPEKQAAIVLLHQLHVDVNRALDLTEHRRYDW